MTKLENVLKIVLAIAILGGVLYIGISVADADEEDENNPSFELTHIPSDDDQELEWSDIDNVQGDADIDADLTYDADNGTFSIDYNIHDDLDDVAIFAEVMAEYPVEGSNNVVDFVELTDSSDIDDDGEITLDAPDEDTLATLTLDVTSADTGTYHGLDMDFGTQYETDLTHNIEIDYVDGTPEEGMVITQMSAYLYDDIGGLEEPERTSEVLYSDQNAEYVGSVDMDVGDDETVGVISINADTEEEVQHAIDVSEDDGGVIEDVNGNDIEITVEEIDNDDSDDSDTDNGDADDDGDGVISDPSDSGTSIPTEVIYGAVVAVIALLLAVVFGRSGGGGNNNIDNL